MRVAPSRLTALVVLSGALAACGGTELPRASEAAQSLRDGSGSGIIISNGLPTRALTLNALTANPAAVTVLVSKKLSTATFDPVLGDSILRYQLHEPGAQAVMKDLVECALKPGQRFHWQDPFDTTAAPLDFEGKASLCPEWQGGTTFPISQDCERRVSACLLARNNAFGVTVPLSVRGQNAAVPSMFALGDNVPLGLGLPYAGDTRVTSFDPCSGYQAGVSRNCGWTPRFVGKCNSGSDTPVRLGAGGVAPDQCGTGAALGSRTGDMILRVCAGTGGCDSTSDRLITSSEGTCGTIAPAVSFRCPASGTYAVMANTWSTWEAPGSVYVKSAANDYPAPEVKVFKYREGAFFGTLFDPTAFVGNTIQVDSNGKIVATTKPPVKGSVYTAMFSCYAPEWTEADAYEALRVCTYSGTDCAAVSLGACVNADHSAGVCNSEDGSLVSGDRDFAGCKGPSGADYPEAITTYLDHPCDLTLSHKPDSDVMLTDPICARTDVP